MTEYPLHGIALYNPNLLSRHEVKRYFVGRQALLDRILSGVRRERPEACPQHRLIIGQRGMGKTTLLRRLAIAIEEDETLSSTWLPLSFPEEQYNVANLAGLWLNCLDAVGDYLESRGDSVAADSIDTGIDQVGHSDNKGVLRTLINHTKTLNRRLILLIDNIDLIFDRLKPEQWALRDALQAHPEIMIIGASARAIEATYQYDAAFYDFFQIDELKGFTENELKTTLIQLSRVHDTPQVEEIVYRYPARIKTLHTLTGGNPRTVVLLYSVLAQGLEGDVRSNLEALLDKVTPLYKARFEELPDLSQQLLDKMAVHWDPLTARELAELLGWDVNKVSAQLSRLHQQAVVEKVAIYKTKRTGFQISERFFNIWYLMRSSRRVRRKLIWLVKFLNAFFSREELLTHARTVVRNEYVEIRDAEYSLALAQTLDNEPLRNALENQALRVLVGGKNPLVRVTEIFDLDNEDAPIRDKAQWLANMANYKKHVRDAFAAKLPGEDIDNFVFLLFGSLALQPSEKANISESAKKSSESKWLELKSVLEEEFAKWDSVLRVDTTVIRDLYDAVYIGDMFSIDDVIGAEAYTEYTGNRTVAAIACTVKGNRDADEAAYRKAIEIDAKYASPWYGLGNLLKNKLQRYDEAEAAYRRAIEIDAKDAYPWNGLGNLLADQLQRYDEAEAAYRRAIEIDAKYAYPWNGLGNLLKNKLQRYDEAEAAYRRAIEIDAKYASPWYGLGILLADQLQRYDEAEAAYRRAIEIDAKYASPWYGLGILLADQLQRYDEAEAAYRKAITVEPEVPIWKNSLAWFLYERGNNLNEALRLADLAVTAAPDDLCYLHTYVTILTGLGKWNDAAPGIRKYMGASEAFHQDHWADTSQLFQEVVAAGFANQAIRLLEETAFSERWRPLREALNAVVEGSVDYLTRVAPEIRKPAEALYRQFTSSGE